MYPTPRLTLPKPPTCLVGIELPSLICADTDEVIQGLWTLIKRLNMRSTLGLSVFCTIIELSDC